MAEPTRAHAMPFCCNTIITHASPQSHENDCRTCFSGVNCAPSSSVAGVSRDGMQPISCPSADIIQPLDSEAARLV
jgi:hypothetical protein